MTPLQFEAGYAPLGTSSRPRSRPGTGARRRVARKTSGDAAVPDAARLAQLYRSACEHLALARARAYPAHLTARLDTLTQRAHELIYRRNDYGAARLARLFLIDFPQAVRAHRLHVLVAALVFGLPLLLLGLATYLDPGFILSMHDAATVRGTRTCTGPQARIGRGAARAATG